MRSDFKVRFFGVLFSIALLGQGCSTRAPESLSPPLPPLPSRSLQADADGFYALPSGLADDYPLADASEPTMRRDLETVRATGSRFLRVGISWAETEASPDHEDWTRWDRLFRLSREYGIRILPYVCYSPQWSNSDAKNFWRSPPDDPTHFGDFLERIAHRYRGQALSWELWNEADLKDYWLGSPRQFEALMRAGVAGVHRGDPTARVVLAGMAKPIDTPFFRTLFERPGFAAMFDAFNLHGYPETWSPHTLEQYGDLILRTRQMIDAHAPKKDLWLAEFGYSDTRYRANQASQWGIPVYFGYEHTPEYQAQALWKAHLIAAATETLSLMTWYRIKDLPDTINVIGDSNNRHLGVLTVTGERKPAFYALRLYENLFRIPFRNLSRNRLPQKQKGPVVVKAFEEKNGRIVLSAWLGSVRPGEIKHPTGRARDRRRGSVTFDFSKLKPVSQLMEYDLHGTPHSLPLPRTLRKTVSLHGGEVWIGVVTFARTSDRNTTSTALRSKHGSTPILFPPRTRFAKISSHSEFRAIADRRACEKSPEPSF